VIDQIAGEVGNFDGWRAVMASKPKNSHSNAATLAAYHAAEACMERIKTSWRSANYTKLLGLSIADMLRCSAEALSVLPQSQSAEAKPPAGESAQPSVIEEARDAAYRAQGKSLLDVVCNSQPKKSLMNRHAAKTGRMFGIMGRFGRSDKSNFA
jgi:hypothetical protein